MDTITDKPSPARTVTGAATALTRRPEGNRNDDDMFGKTKELNDTEGDLTVEDFFGDEEAAAEAARLDELHQRVTSVESQINSQFTSLAAYAQIAQEQVEMARAEAKAQNERAERRMTELVERERADRIEAVDGAPARPASGGWGSPDVTARLEALERSVAEIRSGLNECLARQKALADAIAALFEPNSATLPPPATDGPIDDLALT